MNAIELLLPDNTPAGLFLCGECKADCGRDKAWAERCCVAPTCQRCGEAIPEEERFRGIHEVCWRAERFEEAEKLTLWDGWVYAEGYGSTDGYFPSTSELIEYCEDWNRPVPEWVFLCETVDFPVFDMQEIAERIDDALFEDASEQLNGTEELEKALKAFSEANEGLVAYAPNYKRVVLINAPAEVAA